MQSFFFFFPFFFSPTLIVQLPSSRCLAAAQAAVAAARRPAAPQRGAKGVKGRLPREAVRAAVLASAGHRRRCGCGRVRASMAAAGGEGEPRAEGMAAVNEEEDGEENILYDLLVNAEWPPETELQASGGVVGLRRGGGERSGAATSAARREAGGVPLRCGWTARHGVLLAACFGCGRGERAAARVRTVRALGAFLPLSRCCVFRVLSFLCCHTLPGAP